MLKRIVLSVFIFYATLMIAAGNNFDVKQGIVSFSGQSYCLDEANILLTPQESDSPFVFNDALKAIEAINKSEASKMNLFVSPSVYWLDDPDDPAVRYPAGNVGSIPYAVEINCDTLSIIGLSENPADVVFAVNRGQTQGAIGNYTMLHFKGKSLHTENMTYGNYCNIDLIYPDNPALNRQKRNDAIVQAQLGICESTDRVFARNCRFLSRLNLCPLTGGRRSLYKDCYFECTDDALTGSAVYLDCKFTFFSGKPFYSTSKTGVVFLNCDIHSLVDGIQYLTKMPGMVTMIDTRFTSDRPMELQWTHDISPVRCYQSNVTVNGKPVKIDAARPELGTDITDSPLLKAYKVENSGEIIYNTPNLLGGNDGWDPLGMLSSIRKIEEETSQPLTSLPVALSVISSSRQLAPQGDTLCLIASPRRWGDYPVTRELSGDFLWEGPASVSLGVQQNHAVATSGNLLPQEIEGFVSASTAEGLVGAAKLKIQPLLKDAPEFINPPSLSLNESVIKVNYSLPSGKKDESFIVWYRSRLPDGTDAIPVRQGRGGNGAEYPLTSGDHGYFISAEVSPKLSDTHQGQPVKACLDEEVKEYMSKSSPERELELSTSFAEIPIIGGQPGIPGFWNFDSYKPLDTMEHDWKADGELSWYYGRGTDASTGVGLVQATRGARLSYTPTLANCKTMKMSIIAEPCKGPGQGFGSATGQYMDICIKFDPLTLSGYALRIERTPDYDKAVTFTLVHYNNGQITPISNPVASNCFRNPCHISLEITEDTLTARAFTEAPAVEPKNPEIKPSVNLSAPVEVPTTNSSFAIQHTGTVGASAILLRDLNVAWQ